MWTRNYLKLVKLQPVTRYQSRLLIRWYCRWFYLKTLPECSTKVLIHKVPAGALGSMAAWRSHTWKKNWNNKTRNSPLDPTNLNFPIIRPAHNPLAVKSDAPDQLLVPLQGPQACPALNVPEPDGVVWAAADYQSVMILQAGYAPLVTVQRSHKLAGAGWPHLEIRR